MYISNVECAYLVIIIIHEWFHGFTSSVMYFHMSNIGYQVTLIVYNVKPECSFFYIIYACLSYALLLFVMALHTFFHNE